MYRLRNILDKNPIQISAAVVAVLNVPVVAGAISLTTETVGAMNVALVAVLSLFVSSKTANRAVLDEIAQVVEQGGDSDPVT